MVRHVYWMENELKPTELIPNNTVIFLGDSDSIVQVQTIRRMMMDYRKTVRVLYEVDGAPHGALLLSPAVNNRLMNELYALSEKDVHEKMGGYYNDKSSH